jgi:TonB family protein
MHMADTKALFTQRFDAARAAWAAGDEPAAAESLHWAIVVARGDPGLRRELASALFNLGKLSRKLGRAGEAEAGPLLTEALAISEELFGSKDAALGPVLHELSRLYLQQAQHARAGDALERLLVVARVKGDEHPDVATVLSDLAFVKRKLGDEAAAESLYRDALRIREKVLEPNHTLTVGTVERLSETCAARGNFTDALSLLQRALPVREAALGGNHERVRAARSRIAELELQIAIAADTAARAKDAKPTPVWLKRVPDSPADTPSSHAPSPVSSKELKFLGESEPPALRPPVRPRERSKTPAMAAAVAAASLMASPMKTPSASQIVIPPPERAHSSGTTTGRESDAVFRDVVFADFAHTDVPSSDAAIAARRSTVSSIDADSPRPARRRRTALYASAGVAAAAIVIAGVLMLPPRAAGGGSPVPPQTSATTRTGAATTTPVVTTPPPATKVAAAAAAAAVVGAPRTDSLPVVKTTPTHPAAAVEAEQRAPAEAAPELRAPQVDVHVGNIDLPTVPAAPNFDSLVRSVPTQQSAPVTNRTSTRDLVAPSTQAEVERAHTSPKIIGRAPDPGFPEALIRSGPHQGEVVVRFMVDEFGRADVATMSVERSDHELFTQAVRDILPQFRFQPARTLGPDAKPVAAWVSVPFRFTTKKK